MAPTQRTPSRATPTGLFIVMAVSLGLAAAGPADGQYYGSGQNAPAPTREQLQSRLDRLEEIVAEQSGSEEAREARQRIESIRRRLEQGDFRPGDVVKLYVRGESELTGDFRVNVDRALELPSVPDVNLSGVLYAEADSVVTSHMAEFIRDPEVRVQITRRIAILGAVRNPGFYDLPPTSTLSDALMAAGGPDANAKLEKVKLRRNGKNVLDGRTPDLQEVTLADLGAGSNDQLVVPTSGGGFGFGKVLGVISGISGAAWGLSRIF